MKAGTTYLHDLLASHPDIFMSDPKEPCHFVAPEQLRRGWPQMYHAGFCGNRAAYLDLFRDAAGHRVIGESSTLYAFAPILSGVPEGIAAMIPAPRFIYLMRNPTARTISHYWHDARVTATRIDPAQALTPDSEYLVASDYARQLEAYIRVFGRECILAETFEVLTSRPEATLGRILQWLGVSADHRPVDLDQPKNAAPETIAVHDVGGNGFYRLRQSRLWRRLATAWMPWRLKTALARLLQRQLRRDQLDLEPIEAQLRRLQGPQIQRLETLLEREFPEWTTEVQPPCDRAPAHRGRASPTPTS
jgi:hypothetical protein